MLQQNPLRYRPIFVWECAAVEAVPRAAMFPTYSFGKLDSSSQTLAPSSSTLSNKNHVVSDPSFLDSFVTKVV